MARKTKSKAQRKATKARLAARLAANPPSYKGWQTYKDALKDPKGVNGMSKFRPELFRKWRAAVRDWNCRTIISMESKNEDTSEFAAKCADKCFAHFRDCPTCGYGSDCDCWADECTCCPDEREITHYKLFEL
jgi:hypothetical protein